MRPTKHFISKGYTIFGIRKHELKVQKSHNLRYYITDEIIHKQLTRIIHI